MIGIYTVITITILLSFVTVTLQVQQKHSLRFISKCLASLGFMAAAFLALSTQNKVETWHFAIVAALLLGLMGDVFLGTKELIKKEFEDPLMLGGLIFFLLGHIAYILVFSLTAARFNYWMLALLAVFPIVIYSLIKFKAIEPGKASIPMIVYSLVIGAMAVAAINYLAESLSLKGWLIFIGAVLFCLSDTLLAFYNFKSFKNPNNKQILSYIYLPAYYTAQSLFALVLAL